VALFTAAEARAFDRGQLADSSLYPDADITAKAAEIKQWLERACGVEFETATHTNELHSGDGTAFLTLCWPLAATVTGGSIRSGTSWTALTAAELANIHIDPDHTDRLYREGAVWPAGLNNIEVTYTAGHATVPYLIKRAALWICVTEMPSQAISGAASDYDDGTMSVSYAVGDGFNGAWHSHAEVRKAINLYSQRLPGIA